jgi:hypothetical protein
MTRATAASSVVAIAASLAIGAVGFPRPAIAALVTFAALLSCGAQRAALVVALLMAAGLIVATSTDVARPAQEQAVKR